MHTCTNVDCHLAEECDIDDQFIRANSETGLKRKWVLTWRNLSGNCAADTILTDIQDACEI